MTDQNNPPAISVILPFYNAQNTLARCLESLLQQTFTDFECLLIDNNSSDESAQIAKNLCNRDPRFILLNENVQGVMHAFNTGLSAARGRYIARTDADDVNMPMRLEQQYKYLESHKECGVVASKAKYVAHDNNTAGFARYVRWSNSILAQEQIKLNRFVESPVINPTVMWRKDISERYGSNEDGSFPEDYELWLRWLEKEVIFHKLDKPLIEWHDSPQRLTRTDPRYENKAFFMIKSHYLAKWLGEHNPFHPEVWIWGASKISRKRASLLTDFDIVTAGFIDISNKRQLGKKVLCFEDIPPPDKIFILVYLKEQTMRSRTQQYLKEKGYREGLHYLLVS